MKETELSRKIKNLRLRKGYSQEELAEHAGLSLRTVQRIENGETEPRGDTLKRLAQALGIGPDELLDWAVEEDPSALLALNLSALCYLLFPLLGVIVPLVIWVFQKDKIRGINEVAKDLLNFQITWVLALFGGYILLFVIVFSNLTIVGPFSFFLFWGGMYFFNGPSVVRNVLRIKKGEPVRYELKYEFIG
ncbi:hypothetical protein FUAX_06550 [Fulvitalea axinellae]|uniref:HTH cro/C1-type domain-containing protein n=1 Tax=Fulvitalea axinellae TaxID=1182444 RepID=A0AAU9CJQ6_9BACT|nr:hypothetical protein FUAX_06550 [Fulvitalea axinellae]